MKEKDVEKKVEDLEKRVGIIEKFIAWWHDKHWRWFTQVVLKKKEQRTKEDDAFLKIVDKRTKKSE